jgi:hypothetical protein
MARKPLKQLPMVTTMPTLRPRGSFTPISVEQDPDEPSQFYLHIYGYGVDVRVDLDKDQLQALVQQANDAWELV